MTKKSPNYKICRYCKRPLCKKLHDGYIIVAGHKFCSYKCIIEALWNRDIKIADIWK